MLKKNAFFWNGEAEVAFNRLKKAKTTAPVLALANFHKPYIVETDACSKGIGVVLMQEGKPLAFFSKALGPKNLGLSTYEKEYLAVLSAVDRWKHYLQSGHFIILTDHQSLKFLLEQRVTTALQLKGLTKLMGMEYEVQYKKGTENRVADALSRRQEEEESELRAISGVEPTWMLEVSASYEHNPFAQQLITELITNPVGKPDYTLTQGIIRYKLKLFVGKSSNLRLKIFENMHQSPLGGHSGQQGTYKRVKMVFYWPTMRLDIFKWVSEYDLCQRIKVENVPYPGLLQPLPIPQAPWQDIAMDFKEGLPFSG